MTIQPFKTIPNDVPSDLVGTANQIINNVNSLITQINTQLNLINAPVPTVFASLVTPAGGASGTAIISDSPSSNAGTALTVGGGNYTVLIYYDTSVGLWRVA